MMDLLRQVHNALNSHRQYLEKSKKPHINWKAFGASLGENFFLFVQTSGEAKTLLKEPPREYFIESGWQPQQQTEIKNASELFTRGVCQVRNNIEHTGKFQTESDALERQRSIDLAKEALWILREAVSKHPDKLSLFPCINL